MFKIIAIAVFACVLLVQYSETAPAFQVLPAKVGYVPVYIRNGDTPLAEISPDLAEAFHENKINTRQIKMEEAKEGSAAEAKVGDKKPEEGEHAEVKASSKRQADQETEAETKPQNDQAPLEAMKIDEKKLIEGDDVKPEEGKMLVHSKREATSENDEMKPQDEAAPSQVLKIDEENPAAEDEVKKSSKRQAAEEGDEKKEQDNADAPNSDAKPTNDAAPEDAAPPHVADDSLAVKNPDQ